MQIVEWNRFTELAKQQWWYLGIQSEGSLSELGCVGPRYVTSYVPPENVTHTWGHDNLSTQERKAIVRRIYKVFLMVLLGYAGVRVERRMPHLQLGRQETALLRRLWKAANAFGIRWHQIYRRVLVFDADDEAVI
jgi:hypothetical protein